MLIIIDLFSKFIEAVPMYDQSAESVKEGLLTGWIHQHGLGIIKLSGKECGRKIYSGIVFQIWDKQDPTTLRDMERRRELFRV